MKKPQPDLGEVLLSSFINNIGSCRKFEKTWGTTTVNGVSVLKNRHYYYPRSSRPDNYEKLFRFLGAYKDIENSKFEGVESAWIYLNKNKSGALPKLQALSELDSSFNDFVAYNLNQVWWDQDDPNMPTNLKLLTSIVIEAQITSGRNTTPIVTPLLNNTWPKDILSSAIKSNYSNLWDTCLISQQGIGVINKGFTQNTTVPGVSVSIGTENLTPNDPWLGVIARYAMLNSEIPTTIKKVELGYAKTEENRLYQTYVVTIELSHTPLTADSPLVQKIVDDLSASYSSKTRTKLSYPNGYYTQTAIQSMDSTDLENDEDLVTRTYRLWENQSPLNPKYAALWVSSEGQSYLKSDVLIDPRKYGLTFKDAYSYVSSLIDNDYRKEKVAWWKKALAVVIFIVAVAFALPTGGTSLTATAVSSAILAGALVVTLFTLAFSAMGMHDMASAFAEVSKTIEPLVMVASVIMLGNNLNQIAAKFASQEAATQFAQELAENFIDDLVEGATDLMQGSLTEASMSFSTKISKLLTNLADFKLESISDKNKDLKAEYEQLTQELNREVDVLQGFMNIYASPATADWSIYAGIFDQPYERGGGPFSLGNVQRTTKQALRKASYDDPIFENILTV
jgi:hypothetical protein